MTPQNDENDPPGPPPGPHYGCGGRKNHRFPVPTAAKMTPKNDQKSDFSSLFRQNVMKRSQNHDLSGDSQY